MSLLIKHAHRKHPIVRVARPALRLRVRGGHAAQLCCGCLLAMSGHLGRTPRNRWRELRLALSACRPARCASQALSHLGGGDHHESRVHAEVRRGEATQRQQEEVCWANKFEDACQSRIEDGRVDSSRPPLRACELLPPLHLVCFLAGQFAISDPEVGARVKHIQADDCHDDASRPRIEILVCEDGVARPRDDRPYDQQQCPILHDLDRRLATVAALPEADVHPIELVPEVLLDPHQDREQLHGSGHVEQLVGAPNVVHGQMRDLIGLHRLLQRVAEGVGDDHPPIQDVHQQHEEHHALELEMVMTLGHSRVVVEPDPEERSPKPHKVSQVVHGDQQSATPSQLVRKDAAFSPERFAKGGDAPQDKQTRHQHDEPHHHLHGHLRVHSRVLDAGAEQVALPEFCDEPMQGLVNRDGDDVHDLLAHQAELHNQPRVHVHGHKPEQREDEGDERQEGGKHHPMPLLARCQSLQGEYDASLSPALCGSQVAHGCLGHPIGKLAIDELGVPPRNNSLQAAGCVLDLAAFMEGSPFDDLNPLAVAARLVAHSDLLALPDGLAVAVLDHPRAIRAT
mmetsp:Transcript_109602/g.275694  ORF Transcript_109602/g.275694 Transcript_109602/m.275694 type:complete len:569 (-) Transcript_109602:3241-4947(-)